MMDWIPMAEKEPEKDGWYWFTTKDGMVKLEVIHNGNFFNNSGILNFESCIAWQLIEKPDPYEPPMTEWEALKELSDPIVAYNPRSGLGKALNLAREALEKRIPKKIDMSREYVCPACNHKVFRSPGFQYCYYCYHCGQALEWEK